MVIVGDLVATGERRDHEIVGDAPDRAARLQMSAQPGTVAIGLATRQLIGSLFDYRGLGAIETAAIPSRCAGGRCWERVSSRAGSRRYADQL